MACDSLPVCGGSIVAEGRDERLPSVRVRNAVKEGAWGTGVCEVRWLVTRKLIGDIEMKP